MRKLENVLSDSMVQIENVANKAQSDLNNDELFVEGEINYDGTPEVVIGVDLTDCI